MKQYVVCSRNFCCGISFVEEVKARRLIADLRFAIQRLLIVEAGSSKLKGFVAKRS